MRQTLLQKRPTCRRHSFLSIPDGIRWLAALCCLALLPQCLDAQNYLRVRNPNAWWGGTNTHTPGWHLNGIHGTFEEATLIVTPQGAYTGVEIYATISANQWHGWGDHEIIWQFDLPANSIVHDSWLWVGDDIIKADVVDFWTALQTYESIVNAQQDPSLLYILPDNRYEIRIFPLPHGQSRRVRLAFLVPSAWRDGEVVLPLVQNLLKSTNFPPASVGIGVPVNPLWGTPALHVNGQNTPMTTTTTTSAGTPIHYLTVGGAQLAAATEAGIRLTTPAEHSQAFVSTYAEGGEKYYQLVYEPQWAAFDPDYQPKRALIMLDYEAGRSSLSSAEVLEELHSLLSGRLLPTDLVHIAAVGPSGVVFAHDEWMPAGSAELDEAVEQLLAMGIGSNMTDLLAAAFAWTPLHPELTDLVLLAASEAYIQPATAAAAFATLQASVPAHVPLSIIDLHDTNVSVLYQNNAVYTGNSHFYGLLAGAFEETQTLVYRDAGTSYQALLEQVFPNPRIEMEGLMDYFVTIDNGICFSRYNLGSQWVSPDAPGQIVQVGRYEGGGAMRVQATLFTPQGHFLFMSDTIAPSTFVPGDTLMREMWYGLHLRERATQAGSDQARAEIIAQSIQERVLTSLTAFLALEPNQGGDPCAACLFNSGSLVDTEEQPDLADATLLVAPNPASDVAIISLSHPTPVNPAEWQAAIFDLSGRRVADLGVPSMLGGRLAWEWAIAKGTPAGLYVCRAVSRHGEVTAKVLVATP